MRVVRNLQSLIRNIPKAIATGILSLILGLIFFFFSSYPIELLSVIVIISFLIALIEN